MARSKMTKCSMRPCKSSSAAKRVRPLASGNMQHSPGGICGSLPSTGRPWLGKRYRFLRRGDLQCTASPRTSPSPYSTPHPQTAYTPHPTPPPTPVRLKEGGATGRTERAAAAALPAHQLMHRAGLAVAQLAQALAPYARTVWLACGPGNNGGDGLEAAMHLQRNGRQAVVTWLGQPDKAPA